MTTAPTGLNISARANSNDPIDRASAAAYVLAIFNREMGVTLHNAKVGSKRDEAMHSLTTEAANLYAGRVLRELIQNAFDGAASDAGPRILLRLDLSDSPHGTLYVANNGNGFAVENVDAISNPAMSNKTPGNFIGHKGLGFRSVELFSDDVQICSKINPEAIDFDGFCFGFASEADEREWLEREGEAEFASMVVGKTHRFQLPVPITAISPDAEKIAADGFSTLIRLPLRDVVATERAEEEMRMLINEKAPITLFLEGVQHETGHRLHCGRPHCRSCRGRRAHRAAEPLRTRPHRPARPRRRLDRSSKSRPPADRRGAAKGRRSGVPVIARLPRKDRAG